MIAQLEGVLKPYPWGSRTALAALRGAPSSPTPEAELWYGAHPAGPARLTWEGAVRPLDALLEESGQALLGPGCVARFGPRLPFLVKLLAAAEPLSLQAHPTSEQARRGYDREEALRLPRGAPERCYPDPFHKPELLVALSPFRALAGFRPPARSAALLRELGEPSLAALASALEAGAPHQALRAALERVFAAPRGDSLGLAPAAARALGRAEAAGHPEFAGLGPLARRWPNDPGLAVALLLEHFALEPGEALFLPAGVLHAYLEGTGVEVMAASDNVLRGGCTTKTVNVPELLSILDFAAPPVAPLAAVPRGAESIYVTPAPEFQLSVLDLDGTRRELPSAPPEVLLVTRGSLTVTDGTRRLPLGPTEACLVTAGTERISIEGTGTVFRAVTQPPR